MPESVAVGDFDSDFDPDLAVANGGSNDVPILASDGEGGTCEGTAIVAVPSNPGRPAVDSAPPSHNSFGL